MSVLKTADAFLLGRRTYVGHADAFEPLPPGDFFGDVMNAPAKYVVSKTLQNPKWRNTTVIRGDVVQAVRDLKAQPGKNILTDGSSQLVHTLLKNDLVDELHLLLYPIAVGGGKRLFTERRAHPLQAGRCDALPVAASWACTTRGRRNERASRGERPAPASRAGRRRCRSRRRRSR